SGGLTLNGTASLGNGAGTTYGELLFDGASQTLGGSGAVLFGGHPPSFDRLFVNAPNSTPTARLTVPAQTRQLSTQGLAGASYLIGSGGAVNADVAGGTITLGNVWSSTGTLSAQNGGTLSASTPTTTNFSGGTLTGGTWKAFANSTLRVTLP